MSASLQTPAEALRGALLKIDAGLGVDGLGRVRERDSVVLPGDKILHLVIELNGNPGEPREAMIRADIDTGGCWIVIGTKPGSSFKDLSAAINGIKTELGLDNLRLPAAPLPDSERRKAA